MLSVRQPEENENISQAPTLGGFGGVVTGQTGGQRGRGTVSGRGSGFTNLQSYIRANESNPNAQLIQQRTGQATQAQRQAQTGFETQAGQARGQLEGIQSQAGLVSSALQDPTKFVSIPENVQRITALRTGQEAIANPTAIQQNVLQGAEGLQSQRGMIGQALQRDVTGTGLQEYLRSQRVNPALATAGENRLDRFLAEQTTSGQQALSGAMTEAERIAALNQPEQVGQIGEIVTQLQANPLATREGILNALTARQKEEEERINNINNLYIATQLGLGANIPASGYEVSQGMLIEPGERIFNKPENLPQVTQERLDEARRQFESQENFRSQLAQLQREEEEVDRELAKAYRASNPANVGYDLGFAIQTANVINSLEAQKSLIPQRRRDLFSQAPARTELAPLYQQYLGQLGRTREQILGQYDPNQLARLRALEQITGGSFNPLLSGRIA